MNDWSELIITHCKPSCISSPFTGHYLHQSKSATFAIPSLAIFNQSTVQCKNVAVYSQEEFQIVMSWFDDIAWLMWFASYKVITH